MFIYIFIIKYQKVKIVIKELLNPKLAWAQTHYKIKYNRLN